MSKRRRFMSKFTRRGFLKSSAAVGGGLWLTSKLGDGLIKRAQALPVPGGTLDPTRIPKYVRPLVVPPAMPLTSTSGGIDYYEIAVRQFQQQILPAGPKTTVWSYGSLTDLNGTLNYPAFTIEARWRRPVRVKWINGLHEGPIGGGGNFLPHLLPVDPTLHWANPPGGDGAGTCARYSSRLPVLIAVQCRS